jgi:hypothetical protein
MKYAFQLPLFVEAQTLNPKPGVSLLQAIDA